MYNFISKDQNLQSIFYDYEIITNGYYSYKQKNELGTTVQTRNS